MTLEGNGSFLALFSLGNTISSGSGFHLPPSWLWVSIASLSCSDLPSPTHPTISQIQKVMEAKSWTPAMLPSQALPHVSLYFLISVASSVRTDPNQTPGLCVFILLDISVTTKHSC